ncbi:MAG: type II toxin-antitoxin system VapC family toxin [Nitrososphaeria archaeon]
MKVVDASVIASFILKEPEWRRLSEIILNSYSVDHAIKETLNAIWKAYKRKYISLEDAKIKSSATFELFNFSLNMVNENQLLKEAFDLACSTNLTVYDALYVALAKIKNAVLYTLDRKQAEKVEGLIEVKLL